MILQKVKNNFSLHFRANLLRKMQSYGSTMGRVVALSSRFFQWNCV